MAAKTQSKKKYSNENWVDQFEALYDLPKQTADNFTDQMKAGLNESWKQLLGLESATANSQKHKGDLKAGESLDVKALEAQKAAAKKEHLLPALDYAREFRSLSESKTHREEQYVIEQQIRQILTELRKLSASSKQLSVELKQVTMESTPKEAGKYHLTFFEWLLGVVRKARERVEESQAWLATFQSKKGEKGYWNMFKKHGTTFGMSNERNVATQTG